jgi:hypothetical protein
MNNILFFLFACALTSNTLAQTNLTVGLPYQTIEAEQKFYFYERGEILAVKFTDDDVTLQKSKVSTLTIERSTTFANFPSGHVIEKVFRIKSNHYLLYSTHANKKWQVFIRKIDFSTGQFVGDDKQLFDINHDIADDQEYSKGSSAVEAQTPSVYSDLNIFTGFTTAALMAW